MPEYEYKCTCGNRRSYTMTIREYGLLIEARALPPVCGKCGTNFMRRIYTPPATPRPTFEAGFNHSFGRHFDTEAQLRDHASRESAARTARTGIEHQFALHDARDPEFAKESGVTEQGMEATAERKRRLGLTDRSTFG